MTPTRFETRINDHLLVVVERQDLDRLRRSGVDISELPNPCWSWVIRWTDPGTGILRKWDVVAGHSETPEAAVTKAFAYFRNHIRADLHEGAIPTKETK